MILLIDCRERATLYAHTRRERITDIHQALLREDRSTVRDEAVALHLTDTQTTITRPTLAGLTSERDNRTATTRMLLVNYHVLQPLVMRRTHEDLHLHHLARLSVVHDLVAVRMHSEI